LVCKTARTLQKGDRKKSNKGREGNRKSCTYVECTKIMKHVVIKKTPQMTYAELNTQTRNKSGGAEPRNRKQLIPIRGNLHPGGLLHNVKKDPGFARGS